MALSSNDPSSFSSPESHLLTHIHLELTVDFSRHVLSGTATLQFDRKSSTDKILVLDTRDLQIKKVQCNITGTQLQFTVGQPVLSLGAKLEVQLPDNVAEKFGVLIEYETSPSCTALQWLEPGQTAGKKHPYLFSQCQAIHARSLLPCQDTPSVKTPYTAKITCDSALVALMSGVGEGSSPHPSDASLKVHSFTQKVPIPSYLVAIVVGALESRTIGPRSKVWSEKEMVEAAAYEFAETEEMIATAEKLLGPYVWGVYDLLVLPPSFPYGGMENPCLTFVTPTLLAGDRSLADVVAHEISHSWTGNLVTNSTWEHFWLNEGHTKFVERIIVAKIRCGDNYEARENFRRFLSNEGWRALQYAVVEVFGPEHEYTKLVPSLKGVDPDDAFSTVPYEKGSSLLMYLEQKLGGPEVFEGWLRAYIDAYKYKSLSTEEWKAFLYDYFKDKKAILDEVDWNAWFFKPGMPVVQTSYDSSLADACVSLCQKWSKASDNALCDFSSNDIKSFTSYQVKEFLAALLEEPALSEVKINKMEEFYKFNAVKNSEIRFRWLRLCLRAKVKSAIPGALNIVNEQGRLKFVRPIYRDLYGWEESRPQALENYKKFKDQMHNLTATMVGKDLKLVQ